MYSQAKVHVHPKYQDKIKHAVTQDKPLSIKIDLTSPGEDIILMTPGQLLKLERAIRSGKKVLTIKLSRKQVKANVKHEGGFLNTLLSLATKFLPQLLGGLATGALSGAVEKAVSGSGLYLGKRGMGAARIDIINGNGLTLTPVDENKYNGLYLKHNDQVYEGKGLLLGPDSPFKNIPLLNLIL